MITKGITMIIRAFDQWNRSETDEFVVDADLRQVGRGDTDHIKDQVNEMWEESMTYPPVAKIEILEVEPESPFALRSYY